MERLRIDHRTEYRYREPVTFGPHRAMMRPREGHEINVERHSLRTEPASEIRWIHDIYGNSIARLQFGEPSRRLVISSSVEVVHLRESPLDDYRIDPALRNYPFLYDVQEEGPELVPYRLTSYPHDGLAVRTWLKEVYTPGEKTDTLELLHRLNTHIFETFEYRHREDAGVQLPCRTLELRSGSCRDFAVLLMEAARHLGFGARFVTGYIQLAAGQHGATHAWTEIYIPGGGWIGFDPTNNKRAGIEHVTVAVARDQMKAMPLSGSWSGPNGAFESMNVSVQVYRPDPDAAEWIG